jgi:6-phosphogluconolactonase (cycloisomerase 2 family)
MKLKDAALRGAVLALACALAGCGSDGSAGAVVTNSPTGLSSIGSTTSSKGTSSGSDDSYTVSGAVTGLTGTGLVLEVNGSQSLAVGANGTFSFPGALSSGSSYVVTVQSQPSVAREICSISNGSGTVGTSAVGDVGVACSTVLGFMYELGGPTNQIYSYGIDSKSGNVIPFGAPIGSGGENPTSILASADGHYLYVTNQTTAVPRTQPTLSDFVGNIATFAVNAETGQLTPEGTPVAAAPFTAQSAIAGRFLFVFNEYMDLPGVDYPHPTLMEYVLDPASGLPTLIGTPLTFATENQFFAMAVSPSQQFLYVLSGDPEANTPVWPTITVYAIDPSSGALTAGQSMTAQVNCNSIVIDPHGRFLYLETAGGFNPLGPASATILPYAIDPTTGSLSAVGSGTPVPTNGGAIVIDPSGYYLYAVNTLNAGASQDTIQALTINQSSGVLSTTGPILETDGQLISAGGMMFDPSGEFLYLVSMSEVNSQTTGTSLTTFTVSAASGSAGQLVPSGAAQQLPIGFGGWSIAIVE